MLGDFSHTVKKCIITFLDLCVKLAPLQHDLHQLQTLKISLLTQRATFSKVRYLHTKEKKYTFKKVADASRLLLQSEAD